MELGDVRLVEPIFLGRDRGELPICESINYRATHKDIAIVIRDVPERSYVISSPCIHQYDISDDHRAICADKSDPCGNHYLVLSALADQGKVEVLPSIDDLRRGEVGIARMPDNLYWRFSKYKPGHRKDFFIKKIGVSAKELGERIESDLTVNKKHTYVKMADKLSDNDTIRITKESFVKEAGRFSFTNNIGELLEDLELIEGAYLTAHQFILGEDITWFLTGGTTWDDYKQFVFELKQNSATMSLIDTETKYSSSIVNIEKDFGGLEEVLSKDNGVENLIRDKPLISSKAGFADVANILDEKRFEYYTGDISEPLKV